MAKKTFTSFLLVCLIAMQFACSDDATETKQKIRSEVSELELEEAKSLALNIEELKDMPNSLRDLRRAAIFLSEYTTLKGNQYYLDITKKEAMEKGITAEQFDNISMNLEACNKAILQAEENGDTLVLHDVKAEAKSYKEANKNNNTGDALRYTSAQ